MQYTVVSCHRLTCKLCGWLVTERVEHCNMSTKRMPLFTTFLAALFTLYDDGHGYTMGLNSSQVKWNKNETKILDNQISRPTGDIFGSLIAIVTLKGCVISGNVVRFLLWNLYYKMHKSHNLNVYRLVLRLSLPNPLKLGVKYRMKL